MKRYNDLKHEELVVLTEEDIERFIDIEIAYNGIMPVSCPEVPSLAQEGIVATEIAFEVHEILCKTEEDAIAISRMEVFRTDYDYNAGGYDYKWLSPILDPSITKKTFYKQSDIVRIKDVLAKNKEKKSEYEKKKEAYDKYLKATGQIRSDVYAVYREAIDLQRDFDAAKLIHKKYLELANQDSVVAMGFFKNTYKDRPEIIKAVLGEEATV